MRPGGVCELGLEVWGSKRRVAQPYCLKLVKVGMGMTKSVCQQCRTGTISILTNYNKQLSKPWRNYAQNNLFERTLCEWWTLPPVVYLTSCLTLGEIEKLSFKTALLYIWLLINYVFPTLLLKRSVFFRLDYITLSLPKWSSINSWWYVLMILIMMIINAIKISLRKSSVFIFPILKPFPPASSSLVWTLFSCSGF